MGFFRNLISGLILALFGFSIFTALSAADAETTIAAVQEDPLGAGGAGVCYGLAYTSITPAWQFDWLPPKGEHIFLLEDIPFPDSSDLFILIPVWFLVYFILRTTIFKSQMPLLNKILWTVLIVLLSILVSWILVKLLAYVLTMHCGEKIGLTKETILTARQGAIDTLEQANATQASLTLTLFSSLALLKTLVGGKKE